MRDLRRVPLSFEGDSPEILVLEDADTCARWLEDEEIGAILSLHESGVVF